MKTSGHSLYLQVLIAIALGILCGYFFPETARAMKPLADGFIKLIKLLIAPIIFCSIIHGIASLPTMGEAGRIGGKAMVYFLALSSLSLIIGMVVANLLTPGVGMHVDAATLDTTALTTITSKSAAPTSISEFLLHIIPASVVQPFVGNELLQVLFLALLVASALVAMGEKGRPITHAIDGIAQIFFTLMGFIMKLAPIGAFGAMAFTVGQYGVASLLPLLTLLMCFYLTCALFVIVVLGLVMRSIGVSLLRLIVYIRDEIFITFGTSSSESALPRLLTKLEDLGCGQSVVRLVLPTGYSFNLDGTAIYLSLAAIFLAQATDTPMTTVQQLTLLAVMLLTSKGAAGVTGAGFITLSATLATVGHIPVASVALILGVDRFMSEGRAVTNIIGNAVATVFVAHWEKALDRTKLNAALTKKPMP